MNSLWTAQQHIEIFCRYFIYFQERIDEAENSFMFEVRMLERDYDLADPESKTKFFYAVARKILNFEEELERENYIEAVAENTRSVLSSCSRWSVPREPVEG